MCHDTGVVTGDGGGREVIEASTPGSALIKWTSRLGVWGLAGGFLPVMAFSFGAPISLPTAIAVMAGGFVVGGLSTTLASVLVGRRCPHEARALRLAAALGAPMGLIFATVGVSTFFGWQIVSSLGGLTMAGIGVAVLVLLVAGFMKRWSEVLLDAEE